LRLNLGCGNHYAEGWTNLDIDSNDQVRPDVVHDVTKPMDFVVEPVDRIYAGHVLEHLDFDVVVPTLELWRTVLAPDGEMVVVGPDCDRAEALVAAGELTDEDFRSIRYGRGAWEHDVHLWRSSEAATTALLDAAGWKWTAVEVESLVESEYPLVSGIGWQFAVRASY